VIPATQLEVSPLWPASLDHLRIDSPAPDALAAFYERVLEMKVSPLDGDLYLAEAADRRLVIGKGEPRGHPWSAFALEEDDQLARYRRFVHTRGGEILASPTSLFGRGGFAVRDPDGRRAIFGVPAAKRVGTVPKLAGRLQHVVVASERFPAMMAFYRDVLGFFVSDTVHADNGEGGLGDVNVCFLRSNLEHHSFAVFRAPRSGSDHFALEVPGWDDIRRWADHFAAHDIGIWWGPGRHGAGNNLFFMVKDPEGNNVEISAELERLPQGAPGKRWPAGGKALNLWGPVWTRDTGARAPGSGNPI
jgi:catechol 2,3-dioxygenase-like lactoylglutathione lyase family enzyme